MGLAALAADYLFVGPLVVARLAAELAPVPSEQVETADQLVKELRAKALKVMWAGDRIETSESGRAGGGSSQLIHQRWLVALMLQNAGQKADARHTAAGPLLSQVHAALAGWVPEGANRPIRRAPAPLPPQFLPTHAMYPLGFEITLTL
jgi:hypothetical protein